MTMLAVMLEKWEIDVTYVGEVGDTTTNEEDLALGVDGTAKHKIENGTGVVVTAESLVWNIVFRC